MPRFTAPVGRHAAGRALLPTRAQLQALAVKPNIVKAATQPTGNAPNIAGTGGVPVKDVK